MMLDMDETGRTWVACLDVVRGLFLNLKERIPLIALGYYCLALRYLFTGLYMLLPQKEWE